MAMIWGVNVSFDEVVKGVRLIKMWHQNGKKLKSEWQEGRDSFRMIQEQVQVTACVKALGWKELMYSMDRRKVRVTAENSNEDCVAGGWGTVERQEPDRGWEKKRTVYPKITEWL